MWDLFLDWHEFLPHTLFEVLTAVPPIILGWIFGHRKHDAKRHAWKPAPAVSLAEVSRLAQRVERIEAKVDPFFGGTWDTEGRAGL